MNRPAGTVGPRSHGIPGAGAAGSSLVEALVAVAVVMVIATASVPHLGSRGDYIDAAGAARYLANLVYLTRADALKRGVHVALEFVPSGPRYRFAAFADGNRDGVRLVDIAQGLDRQVTAWASLNDHFPKAAFGIVPGVTDPDSGAPLIGSPLRLGGSSLLSFGPNGGVTSGTLYVRGLSEQQYAVRILGSTGRSRVLRFDFRTRRWAPA